MNICNSIIECKSYVFRKYTLCPTITKCSFDTKLLRTFNDENLNMIPFFKWQVFKIGHSDHQNFACSGTDIVMNFQSYNIFENR